MTLGRTAIFIALIAAFVLSGDAIRCHQCNSHLHEDCIALRLNTPRAPLDDQYLAECETKDSAVAFCRKTILKIEVTGEQRIVRNCGWIEDHTVHNVSCFNADDEGFLQTICACHEDGCNAAPSLRGKRKWIFGLSVALCAFVAAMMRRSL